MHTHSVAILLIPLALWILVSGLDDLFITARWLSPGKRVRLPSPAERDRAPERLIAIYIPLWHEHAVTGQMLDRTVSTLNYAAYEIFVGVYPNDALTVRAVREAATRHSRIRVVLLPHPGPTSKGDCLNCIYSQMLEHESHTGSRYEVIVTHDAEDVVHPESLRLINWFSRKHSMVQIPVLALPTPVREFTHGLYCDEFAEYQSKDIPVRQAMGGFLPSNGVGCGFERAALERLAASRGGRIFDPACLTEDYENGLALHALGYSQVFVPIHFEDGAPIATREFFPKERRAAVNQRSRWVAGIALQSWQRHGWRVAWKQRYWLWRDRKGLLGNLLSPLANAAFLIGLMRWPEAANASRLAAILYSATLGIAGVQMGARMLACGRIYGFAFAMLSPLRTLWGNLINLHAAAKALAQFTAAGIRGVTLDWQKTEHHYPTHAATEGRLRLGEVLVRMRRLQVDEIEEALRTLPAGRRLGEHLVGLGKVSRHEVYQALSAQSGIPFGAPLEDEINRAAARTLPVSAARRWRVLPYNVAMGQLHLATTEPPSDEMIRAIARSTTLELRFRLTPPEEFQSLERKVYAQGGVMLRVEADGAA